MHKNRAPTVTHICHHMHTNSYQRLESFHYEFISKAGKFPYTTGKCYTHSKISVPFTFKDPCVNCKFPALVTIDPVATPILRT